MLNKARYSPSASSNWYFDHFKAFDYVNSYSRTEPKTSDIQDMAFIVIQFTDLTVSCKTPL